MLPSLWQPNKMSASVWTRFEMPEQVSSDIYKIHIQYTLYAFKSPTIYSYSRIALGMGIMYIHLYIYCTFVCTTNAHIMDYCGCCIAGFCFILFDFFSFLIKFNISFILCLEYGVFFLGFALFRDWIYSNNIKQCVGIYFELSAAFIYAFKN